MVAWQLYPRSLEPAPIIRSVVSVFDSVAADIDSAEHTLESNAVLAHVREGLQREGFLVETGKSRALKVSVPVLFGRNGKPDKTFDADAYSESHRFVLEVEAGRAIVNNQFLKDLFQACMMQNVDVLGIAVRNRYSGSNDFESVCRFFDTLYASNRLTLPLKGILIVGY